MARPVACTSIAVARVYHCGMTRPPLPAFLIAWLRCLLIWIGHYLASVLFVTNPTFIVWLGSVDYYLAIGSMLFIDMPALILVGYGLLLLLYMPALILVGCGLLLLLYMPALNMVMTRPAGVSTFLCMDS